MVVDYIKMNAIHYIRLKSTGKPAAGFSSCCNNHFLKPACAHIGQALPSKWKPLADYQTPAEKETSQSRSSKTSMTQSDFEDVHTPFIKPEVQSFGKGFSNSGKKIYNKSVVIT